MIEFFLHSMDVYSSIQEALVPFKEGVIVRIQYGSPKSNILALFIILIFIKSVNFVRHCVHNVYRIEYAKGDRVIIFGSKKSKNMAKA